MQNRKNKKKFFLLLLITIILVTGVCGCMDDTKFYGEKKRAQSDEEYAEMMLEYIEKKYEKEFEIVQYIFPEEGFNTNHLQNNLLVKESQTGVITNVYSLLGSPYVYYDNFVSDFAAFQNQTMVSCEEIKDIGSSRFYLYLRNTNIEMIDVSAENVIKAVLVVNVNQSPGTDNLKALYEIYKKLFKLDYEYKFLIVGFTEKNEAFDNYVHNYRVFGTKEWKDYGGTVYSTMTVKEAGLTFDEFQKKCEIR